MVEPNEGAALGQCYRLARQRSAERRRVLAEFTADELRAELAARGCQWLNDLMAQAKAKALAATDPARHQAHKELFWWLYGERNRRLGV